MKRHKNKSGIRYYDDIGYTSRENGPATITHNGGVSYQKDGKYFRKDGGPNLISPDGALYWIVEGYSFWRIMLPDGTIKKGLDREDHNETN
jgi:hypothetical protein